MDTNNTTATPSPASRWQTLADEPPGLPAPDFARHNLGVESPAYLITRYGLVTRVGGFDSIFNDPKTRDAIDHGCRVFRGTACMYERRRVSRDGLTCEPDPVRMAAAMTSAPRPAPRAAPAVTAPPAVVRPAAPAPAPAPAHQSERFAAVMKASGLSVALPDTWFPEGTRLIGVGRDKARRLAAAHADLPLAGPALASFRERIAEESRRYDDVAASALTVEPGGILTLPVDGTRRAAALEPRVLAAVVGRYPRAFPGGIKPWRSLLADDGEHTASVMTRRLRALSSYGYEEKYQRLRIGSRANVGGALASGVDRSIFVVGSDMFMPIPPAAFLAELVKTAPDGARLQLSYDPDSTVTSWYVSMHATAAEMIRGGVGSVFEAGIRGMTADNGSSHFKSGGSFRRAICVNLTVASGSVAGELSMVHRGARAGWRHQLRRSLAQVRQAGAAQAADLSVIADAFSASWQRAESTVLGTRGDLSGEIAGIGSLLSAGGISLPGETLAAAWGATRGEDPRRSSITVADVANVATWAGSHALLDDLAAWKVQTQASALLEDRAVKLMAKRAADPKLWAAR